MEFVLRFYFIIITTVLYNYIVNVKTLSTVKMLSNNQNLSIWVESEFRAAAPPYCFDAVFSYVK